MLILDIGKIVDTLDVRPDPLFGKGSSLERSLDKVLLGSLSCSVSPVSSGRASISDSADKSQNGN
jgi:hypothetical protein